LAPELELGECFGGERGVEIDGVPAVQVAEDVVGGGETVVGLGSIRRGGEGVGVVAGEEGVEVGFDFGEAAVLGVEVAGDLGEPVWTCQPRPDRAMTLVMLMRTAVKPSCTNDSAMSSAG
jgi:hypothetical protein